MASTHLPTWITVSLGLHCLLYSVSYFYPSFSLFIFTNPDEQGFQTFSIGDNGDSYASASASTINISSSSPGEFLFPLEHTALIMIDFQRDFLLPGGFGELLGNNVTNLQTAINPAKEMLEFARNIGMKVIHTLESHLEDLSDCPESKRKINANFSIGDPGPMGRILVRHEYGNDIIPELAPLDNETVIYKNGKSAFWNTELYDYLTNNTISHLLFAGVTTEVCVFSTMCAARDRGFKSLLLTDATASYFPNYKENILNMVVAQGGIVGHTSSTTEIINQIRHQIVA